MSELSQLPLIDQQPRPTVTDQIFTEIYRQVLTLELLPGTKMSEIDVAKAMGVSRQPVRDAFYRLSKMGFLLIRPQRATTVSLISPRAVFQARFIRSALEKETARIAALKFKQDDLRALKALIDAQDAAIIEADKTKFHQLDDLFHREICVRSGLEFAWELIYENKGHMDRVRILSLEFALREAWDDHVQIFNAIAAQEPDQASEAMQTHMARILGQIDRIRAAHITLFEEEV
ncbi:GntR family transcriptional regulator [Albirhodobacter sp. R86504]|uniref:GntR family transcriptional regulator n=1 Tax=Albirhodobacter sp. R86504 TaxID=3093848 RepID=UPI003670D3AF